MKHVFLHVVLFGCVTERKMARENFPSLPGFRFSPLDSELVGYYLRNKISGSDVGSDLILEHDIYKLEPWHLPGAL